MYYVQFIDKGELPIRLYTKILVEVLLSHVQESTTVYTYIFEYGELDSGLRNTFTIFLEVFASPSKQGVEGVQIPYSNMGINTKSTIG